MFWIWIGKGHVHQKLRYVPDAHALVAILGICGATTHECRSCHSPYQHPYFCELLYHVETNLLYP